MENIEKILKDGIEEMPEIKNAFLTSNVNHKTLSSLEKLAELHETLTEKSVMNEDIHWLIRDTMQDLNWIRKTTARKQVELSEKLFSI
tara:strand:- start:1167 stop:1430 length:264 start_codon:yes stop_codon:yes gene_type:complete